MNLGIILTKITKNETLTQLEQDELSHLSTLLQGKTLADVTLDSILVQQKDTILEMIAYNPKGAKAALKVVAPLWNEYSYSYKVGEISQRITRYEKSLE